MDTGSGRVRGSDIAVDEPRDGHWIGQREAGQVQSKRIKLDSGSGSVDLDLARTSMTCRSSPGRAG